MSDSRVTKRGTILAYIHPTIIIWIIPYPYFLLHYPCMLKSHPFIHWVWMKLGSYGKKYYVIFKQREWEEPLKWSMVFLLFLHKLTWMVVVYASPARRK